MVSGGRAPRAGGCRLCFGPQLTSTEPGTRTRKQEHTGIPTAVLLYQVPGTTAVQRAVYPGVPVFLFIDQVASD